MSALSPSVRDTPMLAYDFPLRPGLLVRLVLPRDLTVAEASRIQGFVEALVFSDAAANQAERTDQ